MKILRTIATSIRLAGGPIKATRLVRDVWRNQGLRGLLEAALFVSERTHSSGANPVNALTLVSTYEDWLSQLVNKARVIEPRIGLMPLEDRLNDPAVQILGSQVGDMLKTILERLSYQKFPTVIVVPDIDTIGGAEKVALELIESALYFDPTKAVLVLSTSFEIQNKKARHIENVEFINISRELMNLEPDSQVRLMYTLFSSLGSSRIFNVNSEVTWRTFDAHVELIQIHAKCIGALFCPDLDVNGNDRGYGTQYFSSLVNRIDFFLSDNSLYVPELCDQFKIELTHTKTLVAHQPQVDNTERLLDVLPKTVAWAGRLTHQKNPHLAIRIAELLPDYTFHLFGGPASYISKPVPRNVKLHGTYGSFREIIRCKPSIFLNTSSFDGIPNTLIEAGSYGLPIISTDAGAIRELVGEDRGALIPLGSSPEEFARKISETDAQTARVWSEKMLNHLRENHNRQKLHSALEEVFVEIA
jgi:glycosyltransferase involved in cell wall biosynthesis